MTSVCIDGLNLALPKGSGIATYGRNLIEALNTLELEPQILYGPQSPITADNLLNEIVLADAPQPKAKPAKVKRWFQTATSQFGQSAVPVTPGSEVIWSKVGGGRPDVQGFWASERLYDIAQRTQRAYGQFTPVKFNGPPERRPGAMHWTCPLPLQAVGMPNIYTFHDLIPLKLPHSTTDDKASYMAMCREVARRADHMLAVSENTRQDMIRLLDIPEDRITTTYQSVTLPADILGQDHQEAVAQVEGVFDLGWKDYFLYYGALEPKKNVNRIVEAYLALGTRTPLVIVGGRSWLDGGEAALIASVVNGENTVRKGRIRQYDFLSTPMLIGLIRGAKATLFPSLYEGFGLPVLESMMLETAVLTSTAGSLPEIAGEAALLVDPYDVQAIKQGIRSLDEDADLRADLVTRGRERGAAFSPQAHLDRLAPVYAELGLA